MNDRHPDHSSRLDALEMRVVEQEKTIAELNDVITGQWRLSELREEVQTAATPRGAQEPPPPHY
jgi:SlyX protein